MTGSELPADLSSRLHNEEAVLWFRKTPSAEALTKHIQLPPMIRLIGSVLIYVLSFLSFTFFALRDPKATLDAILPLIVLYVLPALFLAVLGDWFWRTKIGKVAQGPLTDIFFDHVVITDKRVLLYDTSGREAELNSSEIKDADFDWDNGGRVLRLKASAPFNNFVLTRHDLDDVMTILQNQFLLPIPRSL